MYNAYINYILIIGIEKWSVGYRNIRDRRTPAIAFTPVVLSNVRPNGQIEVTSGRF
jgi:hypothetical protein